MTQQPYTRGGQVLSPNDVEYLFRAIKTDVSSTLTRIDSLINHLQGEDKAHLEIARKDLLSVHGRVANAEKIAIPKVMPHRSHAGEHEHW